MSSLSVGPVGAHLGAPALAPAERRSSDWIDSESEAAQRAGVEALAPAARLEVADAWLAMALRLHRGVVDGSRLTLELMAVGAPASLLDRAEACCGELTDVSAVAFGVAAAYFGEARSPGGLEAQEPLRVDPVGLAAGIFCEDFFGGEVALGVHQAWRKANPRPEIGGALELLHNAARNRFALANDALSWLLSGPGSAAVETLGAALPAKISWEGFPLRQTGADDPALSTRSLLAPEWLAEHGKRCLEQALPRLRSRLLQEVCH